MAMSISHVILCGKAPCKNASCVAGSSGNISLSTNSPNLSLAEFREWRNKLLTESDWTQAADSPLSSSKKTEWATYRQTLRDIPSAQSSASAYANITWPTKP